MRFINDFHFDAPNTKLSKEWCKKAINALYHNSANFSLLYGKKVEEIDQYSEGSFDMRPYKRLYRSLESRERRKGNPNFEQPEEGGIEDTKGIDFESLPLIPAKLNSARAIVDKTPVEITVEAMDALAAEKKEEDVDFLVNKPAAEADLQKVADTLGVGKVDLGTTKHSAIPYNSLPYGLDIADPEDVDLFKNVLYNLSVEAAYETSLDSLWEILNAEQVTRMETYDQLKYGISCNVNRQSPITHLPVFEYQHPQNVFCPKSKLPDFADTPARFIVQELTAMEIFNAFGDEIGGKDAFDEMINGKNGYRDKNKINGGGATGTTRIQYGDWSTFKMNLVYCEVRTVDWVGVSQNKKSYGGFKRLTTDEKKADYKIWAQNTITFYWLQNTEYFFEISRLPFSYRTVGQETFQNFTTNIYKSAERSPVELSIAENKKAQIADIKMQHALIKSLPSGKVIDLKGLRSAMEGLNADGDTEYTLDDLLTMAIEDNWMVIDTQGYEKTDFQGKPFYDIIGGLRYEEIDGYFRTIQQAKANISEFTGVNDQLTGQSANPEGLVGLQKLLLNASINALYGVTQAKKFQSERAVTVWGTGVKVAVEEGGDAKKAIEGIVGKKKARLVDALKEIPMHNLGMRVNVETREEYRAALKDQMNKMQLQGILTTADIYMIEGIKNPKDQMAMLAVKQKQFEKKQDKIRAQQAQQQQAMIAQQGQNQQANLQMEGQNKQAEIYAKGDVESKLTQLAHQLGYQGKQLEGMIKKNLQDDRIRGQIEKNLRTLTEKQNMEQQSIAQGA